jgi:hypothetical protein
MCIASAVQCSPRLAEQWGARAGSAHELLSNAFALLSPHVKRKNTEYMGQEKHFGHTQTFLLPI